MAIQYWQGDQHPFPLPRKSKETDATTHVDDVSVAPLEPKLDVEVGEVFGDAGLEPLPSRVNDFLRVVLTPLAFRFIKSLQHEEIGASGSQQLRILHREFGACIWTFEAFRAGASSIDQ